jgi:tetratricopeptide (TPR) repeat protein
VELDPENTAYRMSLLGYCLAAPQIAGGGETRARAHATAIGQVDPAAGRVAWATVHLAEKNPAQAFATFAEVLEQTPHDFQTLYQIGRCAALSGEQLERGEAALRHCLKLTPVVGDGLPGHAHVHFRLGNILEKRGKLVAAREEYDLAATLNPDIRPDKMALKL